LTTHFFLCFSLIFGAVHATAEPANLPNGVYRIASVDPLYGSVEDLAPIGKLADKATILSLGESTHTSGGFYDAKVRMIRYLIEHKGYRAVAFETPWYDAESAQQFVSAGTGTARQGLASLFSVWSHTSVLQMLSWMREWNITHPQDPVVFFGFDTQQGAEAARLFSTYLRKRALLPTHLAAGLKKCLGFGYASTNSFYKSSVYQNLKQGVVNLSDASICEDSLRAIEQILLIHQEPGQEYVRMVTALTSFAAFQKQLINDALFTRTDQDSYYRKAWDARDVGMANIFQQQRTRLSPGKKTIIWAHNSHIGKIHKNIKLSAFPRIEFESFPNMGSYLHKMYGEQYKAIFLLGHIVETTIASYRPHPPGVGAHFENKLQPLKENYLYINVSESPLLTPGEELYFGGIFKQGNEQAFPGNRGDLTQSCDGIFFMKHSPAAVRPI
jgi:erythromycin esterase-like protein